MTPIEQSDLIKAKQLLQTEKCTCVLCKGSQVYTSDLRGVKPLLNFLESSTKTRGFCAADKVVGKAAAMLYCLLQVKQVYAYVMSRGAVAVLSAYGIDVFYDQLTDAIQNRRHDGLCPMEEVTSQIQNPVEALCAIQLKLKELSG